MKPSRLALVLICCLPLIVVWSVIAQTGGECTALVELALSEMGNNCEGTGRNEACYGYNRVDATFNTDIGEDVFSQPADRVPLPQMVSIQTAPLDLEANRWGVALLNVEATLPNTLPGQGVIFLLVGDAQMENGVAPDAAFVPVDPVPALTNTRSNIRSGPSRQNNVVAAVNTGTELAADAQNADGTWVRVVYDEQPGWIARQLLDAPEGSLEALPVITEETRSPMQSFYFTTGIGSPECAQAPDALLIQSPEGYAIDLTANEASIRISSTVLLRTFIGEDGLPYMEILVIDGEAVINNLVVPTGFSAIAPIGAPGEDNQLGDGSVRPQDASVINGDWRGCRPITEDMRQQLLLLEGIPASVLHYLVDLPTDGIGICAPPGAAGQGGNTSSVPGVSCVGFRATSPLDGLNYGTNTFYWDPAPGATRYRVLIYDETGALVHSYETAGAETSLTGNVTDGQGFSYSWEVQALAGDRVACTSSRVTILRGSRPPDQPVSTAVVCIPGPNCNCNGVCESYPVIEDPFTCPADCP